MRRKIDQQINESVENKTLKKPYTITFIEYGGRSIQERFPMPKWG